MGAEPWSYFTPYELDIEAALQKLRQRVFASGEYRGAETSPESEEEALENAEADGTGSILDILSVSETPELCSVCPLPHEQLESLFGTSEPTREMINANNDFYEDIDRGQGIYITVYKNSRPSEYFFAGYSFD